MTVEGERTAPPEVARGLRVVGERVVSHDFVEKVKGSLLYAADWSLPGMLYGRVVRAQVPSARLTGIDTTEARRLPGVVAVLTAADVPHNALVERASGGLGELLVPMPVLAKDRVRYLGEPVALVAAVSQRVADEAAELIVVDYEELPGVFSVEQALAVDAPLVHDEGNTLVTWSLGRGDANAALAGADVVVEGEYRTQRVEHAYLEPEAGVGWMDNGVVTLRVSTQIVEHAAELAEILDLPESRVRVIATYMGGAFGGKEDMTVEPYLALLVWHTRRPVRLVFDRQESIVASTKRHPFLMRYRTGARRDGTLVGQEIEIVGDAGAYPYLSARIVFAGAALACGPYRVPNVSIRSRAVFTNNVPTSAFRGFGAMQVTFAYESQMDRLAAVLGMNPLELRRRNFLAKGDTIPSGERLDTAVAVAAAVDRVDAALGPLEEPTRPGWRVGRGIACNMQPYGRTIWFRDKASAWLSLGRDGTLVIRSGVTDLGAGQAASLCQIAAEVLGVPLADVSVHIGDSALTPPAGGTFATRQLFMSGNAVLEAARLLRDRLLPVAAELLGVETGSVELAGGMAVTSIGAGRGVMLGELARACEERRVETSVLATWHADQGDFDPTTGTGATFPDYTYGAHGAVVEVDPETGAVRVRKYVACHDVGRAINPLRVEGQIQGGAMQGLGYALMEEIVLDEGVPASPLFANYLVPTACDMPDIEVVVLESGEGKGPLGARGIGEPPIGPPAAAVASAIADALGRRPTVLPMTPERVLGLLEDEQGGAA